VLTIVMCKNQVLRLVFETCVFWVWRIFFKFSLYYLILILIFIAVGLEV
jgi:hypothetical protein